MQGAAARGRPRSFDIDAATAALEGVLWAKGYRAASVEELAGAAGLSPSSLYAAYGSKVGVLRAALERYLDEMAGLVALAADGERGLADVVGFVDEVRSVIEADDQSRGCLMVNTMVELGASVPAVGELTATHRDRVEQGLVAALRRAAAAGEVPAATVRDRAKLVMSSVFGALTVARCGDRDAALHMLAGLRREVRRWRLTGNG